MKRALLLAVLLTGCNAGPKPLEKGDAILIDSGSGEVLVWTEEPDGKDRAESALIPCGSRAVFLDAQPDGGLVRAKLDRGPVVWIASAWVVPDGVRAK